MNHIRVVAAVIIDAGRVFAARRNDTGEMALRWEFPGGKLEVGESSEEALVREIGEELSATVRVDSPLMTVQHAYDTFSLTLEAYLCTVMEGELTISEHVESRWLTKGELTSVEWADADIPIVGKVAHLLGD